MPSQQFQGAYFSGELYCSSGLVTTDADTDGFQRYLVRQSVGVADAVPDVGPVEGRRQAHRTAAEAQLLDDVVLHLQQLLWI